MVKKRPTFFVSSLRVKTTEPLAPNFRASPQLTEVAPTEMDPYLPTLNQSTLLYNNGNCGNFCCLETPRVTKSTGFLHQSHPLYGVKTINYTEKRSGGQTMAVPPSQNFALCFAFFDIRQIMCFLTTVPKTRNRALGHRLQRG